MRVADEMRMADERDLTLFLQMTRLDFVAIAIREEAAWCEANPEGAPTEMFHEGFIAGLKQAGVILGEIKRIVEQEQRPVWQGLASVLAKHEAKPKEEERPSWQGGLTVDYLPDKEGGQLTETQVELFMQWVKFNWPAFEEDPGEYRDIARWRAIVQPGDIHNLRSLVTVVVDYYSFSGDEVNSEWVVIFDNLEGFEVWDKMHDGQPVYLCHTRLESDE